jgi:hypothetical protein
VLAHERQLHGLAGIFLLYLGLKGLLARPKLEQATSGTRFEAPTTKIHQRRETHIVNGPMPNFSHGLQEKRTAVENQTRFKNKSDVYTELERRCPKFPILRDVADASLVAADAFAGALTRGSSN